MREINNPHDKFFKETWTQPGVACAFLQEYLPVEVTALLDLSRLRLVKDTLCGHGSFRLHRVQKLLYTFDSLGFRRTVARRHPSTSSRQVSERSRGTFTVGTETLRLRRGDAQWGKLRFIRRNPGDPKN